MRREVEGVATPGSSKEEGRVERTAMALPGRITTEGIWGMAEEECVEKAVRWDTQAVRSIRIRRDLVSDIESSRLTRTDKESFELGIRLSVRFLVLLPASHGYSNKSYETWPSSSSHSSHKSSDLPDLLAKYLENWSYTSFASLTHHVRS